MTELERLQQELATAQLLNASLELDALAEAVVRRGAALAGADTCLLLLQLDAEPVRLAGTRGLRANLSACPPFSGEPDEAQIRQWLGADASASIKLLALVPGPRIRGWLVLCSPEGRPLDADGEGLLRSLARQAAGPLRAALGMRRAEEALQAARAAASRLGALLDAAPDAMVTVDEAGRVVLVNAETERVFGYRRAELLGQTVEMLLPERYRVAHVRHRAAYRSNPRTRRMGADFSLCARRKDGSEFPVEISLSPLQTDEGLFVSSSIRDVSDRRRVVAALQESEERFRTSFEHSPIPKALLDLDGRFLRVNPAFSAFIGYTEDELLSLTFAQISEAEDQQDDRVALEELLKSGGSTYSVEKRYRHKQGHILLGRVSVSVVRGPDGRPHYVVRQIQDITEQRQHEEELRRSEALYRTLSELLPDFVWTFRADGRPGYRNQRWKEYTGLSGVEDEIAKIIHPDDVPLLNARWARAFATGEPYEAEVRIRRHDGVYRWFINRAIPLPVPGDRPVEWLGTSTDITERRQAEAALREQEEILQLSHDAIIVRDFSGHVRFWNRGAEETYGHAPEDACARISHDLLRTRFSTSQADLEAALLRDGWWEGELVHTTRGGTEVIVESRQVLRRDEAGEAHSVLEINRDVTARKKWEAERDVLLESEQRKSEQLAAAIQEAHHRIKNNLQAITDLLSLELGISGSDTEGKALRDSMERIQAIALVHDLLSRHTELEWVSIRQLTERLVPAVLQANTRGAGRIVPSLHLPDLFLPSKQATAYALILNELITNAAKHALGGRASARLEVQLAEDEGRYQLCVRDDGPGLPDGFDFEQHASVGMQVVRTLTEGSLRGRLTLQPGPGLRILIAFPAPRPGQLEGQEE